MYKNILCAIDTSSENKEVLEKARIIAEQNDASLSIIHTIEYSILPKDYQKIMKEEAIPKINKLADKYNITKKNQFIKFGKPYENICNLADKKSIDLIILGSHGRHGIKAILGSTANGVLHYAKCDTLLIKIE